MKGMHAVMMGVCVAIVLIAVAGGGSLGLPLLGLVGCMAMMWMMMRMMGGGDGGSDHR